MRLVEHETLGEGIVGGVGNFTFLACPRSDRAVDESAVENSDSKRPAKRSGCLSIEATLAQLRPVVPPGINIPAHNSLRLKLIVVRSKDASSRVAEQYAAPVRASIGIKPSK